MFSNKTKLILLLSATAGITVTLAYAVYLLTQKDEEEDEPRLSVRTSRNVTIEVKVPKESIGIVIGRGGSTIKAISAKSETRINFKNGEENDEYRTCLIRGTSESAQFAESLILEVIKNQPLVETEEISVPVSSIGLIIGKGGENINAMASMSLAKIIIPKTGHYDPSPERKITIKGTFEQIEMAKHLINDKVLADIEQRQKITENAANRSPRKTPKQLELLDRSDNPEHQHNAPHCEKLISTNSDGFMQVYVSAVCNPETFWVQMITRKSVELDRLVEDMTEYYKDPANRASQAVSLKTVEVGFKLAAQFKLDSKWYRAEITKIVEDEYNPDESYVDVFYVDYGNSDFVKINELCLLRADFLKLTFQAIECSLENVKPKGSETWSEEAIDCFEALCYNAQWKPVMARVNCYKERAGDAMPIPCVDLVDTSGQEDIVVAQELVKQGFAERVKPDLSDIRASTLLPNGNGQASSNYTSVPKKSKYRICPAGSEEEFNSDDDFDFY